MNNITDIENSQSIKTSGSSLIGYVEATYEELIKAFGEPTYKEPSGCGKVTTEWKLEFAHQDGKYVIATIYDWMMYDDGTACRSGEKFKWHVGGFDYEALELVEEALSMFRSRALAEY
tara:strand:+ start:473 stop:826 length:354 start_codon:yes stop_codon:yes gene_type:complete